VTLPDIRPPCAPRDRRRAGRRAKLSAGALALAVAACATPHEREVVVLRLADEAARAAGFAEPPSAAVRQVTRSVLVPRPSGFIVPAKDGGAVTADARGVVRVEGRCPPALAGRPVVVTATALDFDLLRHRHWSLRGQCPTAETEPLTIELDGVRPSEVVAPQLVAYGAPAAHFETAWLTIPDRARLRLALGLEDVGGGRAPPVRFRVTAENRTGVRRDLLDVVLDPARRPEDGEWVEKTVEITRRLPQGTDVRLIFDTSSPGGSDALSFPAWGDPLVVQPTEPAPPRRSVLLVSIDTLRADRLGAHGFALDSSPHIDRLASEGTLFSAATAPSNWTLPSHASMLTGLYPCVHRLGGMPGIEADLSLPRAILPLAEHLRRAGYATAAFTENAYLKPAVFHRGFDLFRADSTVIEWGPRGLVEDTIAHATAWLERHTAEDFFLFVHTYQVHAPYTPPEAYRRILPWDPSRAGPAPMDDLVAYTQEVRYTDDVVARLVDRLDALGLRDRTIVVITSDHGEAFGEHGQRFHGSTVYEEEVHVPFIWRAPGIIAAGRRVADPVSLVDLMPTVLDLLGLRVPLAIQGVNLAPRLRAGTPPPEPDRKRIVYSEGQMGFAVRGYAWKAVWGSSDLQTFFLTADPREQRPLDDRSYRRAALAARGRFGDHCRRVRRLIGGVAPAPPAAPSPLDAERREKLRALGYIP
jgi:arylsulfatase A-like enzyme